MKMTIEDFRPYKIDASTIWIEKRIFKRKYIFFGEFVPTDEFDILVSGDGLSESYPVSFSTIVDVNEFVQQNFLKMNKINIFRYNDL